MKKVIVMNTQREGYGVDQIRDTMTVKQLIEFLQRLDEDYLDVLDMPVYTGHDNQYTYGSILDWHFQMLTIGEDGEILDEEDLA